jgi:ABC-type uncharacterized transport system involved in gliding motility auxiliary subunit
MLGIQNPSFALVGDYGGHAVTEGFDKVTLFPIAAALATVPAPDWQAAPILRTEPRAWVETGRQAEYTAGKDTAGPLTLGVALSRELTGSDGVKRSQRVVITGDGDFLSNSFVGNGGNLELGNRLVNWLSHEDAFVNIPARAAPDVQLELTRNLSLAIGLGFLLVVPGLLLATGITIWVKRRKR